MAKVPKNPERQRKQQNQIKTYIRDSTSIPIKSIKDKKLKTKIKKSEEKSRDAALQAARVEILHTTESGYLETETEMEKTFKFTQTALKEDLDLETTRKMFDLKLDFGPYQMNYSRNGRHLLIGGQKGHIAAFDWQRGKLACEIQVQETVRDVTWLHNDTMFAVAQKKYTYIYDKTGMELHVLKDHIEATVLDFLPAGNAGWLKYQDTSTGKLVAQQRTKLGKCVTMAQNPYNAVMNLGHSNGTVTLWSPSMTAPLVKMLCHKGPVQGIALDLSGRYMATSGLDNQLKVWDIRTYKEVDSYFTTAPSGTLTWSAKGLLAVGTGPRISVWKDTTKSKQKEPYMTHMLPGSILESMEFCPFEDILGVGHRNGFSSLVIPGSGEPNFDTMEANPYQTNKQRQESEVHALLDKIQPEMITLDPTYVGKIDRAPTELIQDEARKEWEANHPGEKFVPQKRARGKSSSQRRYLRKQANVVDEKRIELKDKLDKAQKERDEVRKKANGEWEEKPRVALDRFRV